MFFEFRLGRRDAHSLPPYHPEKPIRLDEVHLGAWARALGQRRETHGQMFRPHLGLPLVVHASHVVSREQLRGLFTRLPRWIFRIGAGHVAQAIVRSGAAIEPDRGIGEARTKPYVWLAETESGADERGALAADNLHRGSQAA